MKKKLLNYEQYLIKLSQKNDLQQEQKPYSIKNSNNKGSSMNIDSV